MGWPCKISGHERWRGLKQLSSLTCKLTKVTSFLPCKILLVQMVDFSGEGCQLLLSCFLKQTGPALQISQKQEAPACLCFFSR